MSYIGGDLLDRAGVDEIDQISNASEHLVQSHLEIHGYYFSRISNYYYFSISMAFFQNFFLLIDHQYTHI